MTIFIIIILHLIIAYYTYKIAKNRNRNAFSWMFYTLFFWLIPFIIILFLPKIKYCKECKTWQNADIEKCIWCWDVI